MLRIDSSLTGVGDLAGLGHWLVVVDVAGAQDPLFLTLTSGFQPGLAAASRSLSVDLLGGPDYVISLINADWINLAPGAFAPGPSSSIRTDVTGSESESGLFSWSIAASVPEPSGWALAILGFGMIGVVQRRRALTA